MKNQTKQTNHTSGSVLNFVGEQMTTLSGHRVPSVAARAHKAALESLTGTALPLRHMVKNWVRYAEQHEQSNGSKIGQDGFLGVHWLAMGKSLLVLLEGDTGGLDAGSLSTNIRDVLAHHGIDTDKL